MMKQELLQQTDFLRNILDAIPSLIFIVDSDVRIFQVNSAVAETFSLKKESIYKKRGGEALQCIHSTDVPEGCGRSEACKSCIIRNSVNEATRGGKVFHKNARIELRTEGQAPKEINLLVTTSTFKYEDEAFVLLILEDINELIQLRSIIPICANCKKIRDEKNFWESVESYFESHIDIDFSHTICKECREKLYPGLKK